MTRFVSVSAVAFGLTLVLGVFTAKGAQAAQDQLVIQIAPEDIVYLQSTGYNLVIVQPFTGTPSAIAWVAINPQQLYETNQITWEHDAYSVYAATVVPQTGAFIMPSDSSSPSAGGSYTYDGSTFSVTAQTNDHVFKLTNASTKAGTFGLSLPYSINKRSAGIVPMQASVIFGQGAISITAPKSLLMFLTTESVRKGQVMGQLPPVTTAVDYSTSGTRHVVTFNRQTGGFDVSN